MAERKPLFMDQTEGFSEEMAVADTMTLGGLTIGAAGNIALSGGGEVTGLPATPSGATAAASKAYVDQLVVTGGPAKGAALHSTQLDNAEGLLGAVPIVMLANPVAGDTITLSDGTTTRTYGASTGGDVQYAIGATPADTMANLVAAINADGSAIWTADFTTNLDAINADGVVVIVENDNDGDENKVYGTWATGSNVQIVDFSAENEYVGKTLEDLPSSDPAATNFGPRLTQASLTDGELRYALESDILYSWDDSTNNWITLSSSAGIPDATSASGGGVKGKVTFDSDKGLAVGGGVAEVKIDAVTIDFDGSGNLAVTGLPALFEVGGSAVNSSVDAAALNTLTGGGDADSEHTHNGLASAGHGHAHSELSGVGTDDHHAQVHAIDGGDHSASGLTTGHVLTALSATTFGFVAPADDIEAKRTAQTMTTAVDVTAVGDPVYQNGNDTIGKALASTNPTARVIGVIESGGGAAGATPVVVTHGIAVGVISGATFNTPYYLQAGGGIGTSLPGGGRRVILVGYAANATDLFVDIRDYAKKAA